MEEITGWNKEEVIGSKCFEILQLRDCNGSRICQKCPIWAKSDSKRHSFTGTISTKEGQRAEVSIHYSADCLSSEKPVDVVLNVREISPLNRLEQFKSELLATVSHELQTPISIIKAFASTLVRDDVEWSRDKIRESLLVIMDESERLNRLVKKILRAYRSESTGITLKRTPLNLSQKVYQVSQEFANRVKDYKLEIRVQKQIPQVLVDSELIGEVLENMLDNAIKYSQKGGLIRVKSDVTGDRVIISVDDEGMGIPSREKAKVFERFYRGEGAEKASSGTGLGLYISKAIIEAHGGEMWLDSQYSKGCRFIFSLPR
jgi:K+-sensing histidine kinase KdpD